MQFLLDLLPKVVFVVNPIFSDLLYFEDFMLTFKNRQIILIKTHCVTLFKSTVFLDEMKVITSDDNSALHFHFSHDSC